MRINDFLNKLRTQPNSILFTDTMEVIETNYDFTPVRFTNGNAVNEAGTNSGSCKLFAFAKLNGLSTEETLACFGDYYRVDVLQHPDATNHANIRNFMITGWEGISFDGEALKAIKS
ncbi:HopJ type III effector protein [Lacibacter sediminis]|uniref:HopJ type III effector protein n=1 Tax=Lacibacter sediminis TaxID=2760713 RepID=A0A7G5XLJ8_9BACT|nr:HopJ type III effector protein [Lacibacter sediminis]QNA46351.1 HopJ type III effector protein [Lacibacter sediminis]